MGKQHSPGWLWISLRRAGAQRGLLAALAALTGAASLLLTGMVGFIAVSANAQVIGTLEAATPSERSYVIQTRLADDAATQFGAATGLLDRALGTPAADHLLVEFSEPQQGSASYVRWTITPNPHGLTAPALPRLIEGLDGLQRSFLDDKRVNVLGVTTEGSLSTTLATIDRRIAAEQTGSLVPVLLVAVVTGVAIIQTARLLGRSREPEFALIRSRGSSARRLWISAAVEAAAVVTPAALVGAVISSIVLGLLFEGASATGVWGYAAAVALAAIAVTTAAARGSIGTATVRESAFAGRSRAAIGVGAVALVLLLAALSLVQFTAAGSPLVTAGNGQRVVDPFLAAAPALVLLAGVTLGLLALSPLARGLDSWAARLVGIVPSLPVRQVARRPAAQLVTVAMAAVTAGAIVIAAGYAGTLGQVTGVPQELAIGTDVRVDWGNAPALDSGQLEGLTGVTASAPVLATSAQYGNDTVELVALPASLLPAVMTDRGGALDLAATQRALAAPVAQNAAIPAVISAAFAERFDLRTGDTLALRSTLLGNGFDLVISGTIAAVPGTTARLAVIADLAAVESALPSAEAGPLTTWISSTDAAATAEAVSALAPAAEVDAWVETTAGSPTATMVALWLAASGSIALAGAAMLASSGIGGRTRSGETVVLRALGMSRRQLAAGARLEFLGVVAFAIVVGAASGFAVCAFTVGSLARAATVGLPEALEVGIAFDAMGLAIGFAVLFAVVGLVAVSVDRLVVRRRGSSRALGSSRAAGGEL